MEYTKEEKHTPEIEVINETRVSVSVPNHPAQSEEHFISNISLFTGDDLIRSYDLTPNDEAVVEFEVDFIDNLNSKATCNIHGTWDDGGELC